MIISFILLNLNYFLLETLKSKYTVFLEFLGCLALLLVKCAMLLLLIWDTGAT